MERSMSPTRSMVCSSLIRFSSSLPWYGLIKQNPGSWPGFVWRRVFSLSEQLAALAGGDAHAQGVELDEARRVRLVVSAAVFLEGRDVGVEQRVVGLAANHDDVAL